jgi:glucose-1-phosphate thymidylyltransferase
MKGIILAGGRGTRLYPATRVISKHLLPIHDKPMIYYSLSTLMLANIRDILLISMPEDVPSYRRLLGDGSDFGIRLTYLEQPRPEGIAQAFVLAEDHLAGSPVTLILGDNVFYGEGFGAMVRSATEYPQCASGATIFPYWVNNPGEFGVVDFARDGRILGIEEKPAKPRSNYAVTGLYVYDPDVVAIAKGLRPSVRGELEITDVNNAYLARGDLRAVRLGRGIAWLDSGTHQALQSASEFVAAVQGRQGLRIACLEEIAFRHGFIDGDALRRSARRNAGSDYGRYLQQIWDSEVGESDAGPAR